MIHLSNLRPCLALLLCTSTFASAQWITNLPAAFEQAEKEDKLVLVDVNGSDWCGPCRMLKSKVFETDAFTAYAKDDFVLVDIDVPRGNHLSMAQKAMNQNIATMFGVRAYPTVLIFNKDGALVGGFRGGTDQLSEVQADLDQAKDNKAAVDAAMAKAASATGNTKVKATIEAFTLCPEEMQDNNTILRDWLIDNDPTDSSGLAAKEQAKADELAARKKAYELTLGMTELQRFETIKKELQSEQLSDIYRFVLSRHLVELQFSFCETAEDLAKAKEQYLKFGEQYPSEKEEMEATVAELNQMGDEKLLQELKAEREYEARRAKK